MQAHSSNATQNQIHQVVKKLLPTKSYYATHNALHSTIMQLTKLK
jgi:hypothetical protein